MLNRSAFLSKYPFIHKPEVTLGLQVFVLLAAACFLIAGSSLFSSFAPFISVLLSWLWFILPGLVLSFVLYKRLSWLERLPVAYVLFLGASTPFTILAILFRMTLNQLLGFSIAIFLLAVLAFLIDRLRMIKDDRRALEASPEPSPELDSERSQRSSRRDGPEFEAQKLEPRMWIYVIILVIIGSVLAYLAWAWPVSGDDIAGLPYFEDTLHAGRITGTEPYHGTDAPATPRNELIVWGYQAMLINKVAGVSSIEFFTNTRSILLILSLITLYTLLRQFSRDQHLALFSMSIWCLYLLSTLKVLGIEGNTRVEGVGNDLVTRIFVDKYMGWFLIVPAVLVLMLWTLQSRRWGTMFAFGLGAFGAALSHPITLVQILILGGSFGILYLLFEHSRQVLLRLVGISFILALCLVIPIIQYFRFMDVMPVDKAGLADAIDYGRIFMAYVRYRIWLLGGNQYILHPAVLLQPIFLVSYPLLLWLIFQLRSSNLARLVLGTMLSLPLLLYIPPLAKLAGKFVTPYLIWRLAWPLQTFAVVIMAMAAWSAINYLLKFTERTENRRRPSFGSPSTAPSTSLRAGAFIRQYIFFLILAITALALRPQMVAGWINLRERLAEMRASVGGTSVDAILFLNKASNRQPINVLASPLVNFYIPGYAPYASVVEYRGYGTVNRLTVDRIEESMQRVEDTAYFEMASSVDDKVFGAIKRWDIDYVMVERDKLDFELQFRLLTELFEIVYSDNYYSIFAVKQPLQTSLVVEGNSYLRKREWDKAERAFTSYLEENPDHALAYLGLGLANEGQGDIKNALTFYQEAIYHAETETALYQRLAEMYLHMGDFDQAARVLEMAVSRSPDLPQTLIALGRVYALNGEEQNAQVYFKRALSLRFTPGTADYFSRLGDIYLSVSLPAEAIQCYQQAIAIEPDPYYYITLAQALDHTGDALGAEEALKRASRLDPWHSLPHMILGEIYHNQGRLEEALQEYETARRLHPAMLTPFVQIGYLIKEISGIDAAITRMEELKSFHKLLPGPQRVLASLYAEKGDQDRAIKSLDEVAAILPYDTYVPLTKGWLYAASGDTTQAKEAFDYALELSPSLVSAHLGLGFLYAAENDLTSQAGEIIHIMDIAPYAIWPHLQLAKTYRNMGEWDSAKEQIDWVLKIDPDHVPAYLDMGDYYLSRANWELAIASFQKAYELDQTNPEALLKLGRVYHRMGDWTKAQNTFERVLQADPENEDAQEMLADVYWQQGQFSKATNLREARAEDAQSSIKELITLAREAADQGNKQEAIRLYRQAIESDPTVLAAYISWAILQNELERNANIPDGAIYTVLEANPGTSESYMATGKWFQYQGLLDQAEQAFQRSISAPAVDHENYVELSQLQLQMGDWQSAVDTLQDAIQAYPSEQGDLYQRLGEIYFQRGDFQEARSFYNLAIHADPSAVPAYIGLSRLESYDGDDEQAIKLLQQALTYNPTSAEAQIALALYHESHGSLEQAEGYLENALASTPSEPKLYQSFGQYYRRQGRYEEALEIFTRALDIPSNQVAIMLEIGDTYFALNDTTAAEQWYQKAISSDNTNVYPYLSLAALYSSQERWVEAIAAIKQAISIQPASVDAHLALGDIYQKQARWEDAREQFQAAYSLDQSRPDGLISLAKIALLEKNSPQAVERLKQAIKGSPTNLDSYLALAQVYRSEHQFDLAEAIYTQAIQSSFDKQSAVLSRGEFYLALGMWNEAERDFQTAWNISPGLNAKEGALGLHPVERPASVTAGLQLAGLYQRRGYVGEALYILQEVAQLPGGASPAAEMKASLYAAQADWPSAIAAYQQAIQLDVQNIAAYLGLAKVYELQGRTEEALRVYKAAVSDSEPDPQALINLARAYQDRLDYPAAISTVEKVYTQDRDHPGALISLDHLSSLTGRKMIDLAALQDRATQTPSADLFILLGDLNLQRGDWWQSAVWYMKAVYIEPNHSAAWIKLGDYYQTKKEWAKAMDAYQKALQSQPTSASSWIALANSQRELGMLEEAAAAYRKAIEIDPSRGDAYASLANLLIETGDTEGAFQIMQAGMTAATADPYVYEALGRMYVDAADLNSALSTYRAGLERIPGAASIYVAMGDMLAEQASDTSTSGQIVLADEWVESVEETLSMAATKLVDSQAADEALSSDLHLLAKTAYLQALSLQPGNLSALFGLGRLYTLAGFPERAFEYYQRAVEINPVSVSALVNLGYAYLASERRTEAAPWFQKALVYDPLNREGLNGLFMAYQSQDHLNLIQASEAPKCGQDYLKNKVDHLRRRAGT